MYESEVHGQSRPASSLPPDVLDRFREYTGRVSARTTLPWGEHCTECAVPECFLSCRLYEAREDGKCRRFSEGMVKIDCPGSVNGYLIRIDFKRWGMLHAPANLVLRSTSSAALAEWRDARIGSVIRTIPGRRLRQRLMRSRGRRKVEGARARPSSGPLPTGFLFECFNPGHTPVALTVVFRPRSRGRVTPHQELIRVEPGFLRTFVPFEDIEVRIDVGEPFGVDIVPEELDGGATLVFGALDFVVAEAVSAAEAKLAKCVVWDLDNTLWSGTLLEDGPEVLRLRPGVEDAIEELDRRGILHSIASKNNPEDALAVVKRLGMSDYFIEPQVGWHPKSQMLDDIAAALNIGVDTLLFIDDSPFERAEVSAAKPNVIVVDADGARDLPRHPALQVPVSATSGERRRMYREQSQRKTAREGFSGDYVEFLRACDIHLVTRPMTDESLVRVHELTERTNQMNFSGSRYAVDTLRELMGSAERASYVLDCRDRFGSYGTIGFGLVDVDEPRLIDLTFSCRVQSKRVEHAFLTFLLSMYLAESRNGFYVNYKRTDRNAPSGRVFEDFGFDLVGEVDGVRSLRFPKDRPIPDDEIVHVAYTQPTGSSCR